MAGPGQVEGDEEDGNAAQTHPHEHRQVSPVSLRDVCLWQWELLVGVVVINQLVLQSRMREREERERERLRHLCY